MRAGYLRRTSLLYRPPYLFRCAASSVISGIQLANTAYDTQQHREVSSRAPGPPPRARPAPPLAHEAVCDECRLSACGCVWVCGTWVPCRATLAAGAVTGLVTGCMQSLRIHTLTNR